jgi:hypothetical protein
MAYKLGEKMAYRELPFSEGSGLAQEIGEDREFSGEEFLKLPADQRAMLCARAAERAHNLANSAPERHKRFYLDMAQQWLLLAEAILKESLEKKRLYHPR